MNHTDEFIQRDRGQHPPAHTPDYKSTVLRSPRLALFSLQNSLSEVTGPRFAQDALGPLDDDLIRNYAHGGEPIGERIVVHGWVRERKVASIMARLPVASKRAPGSSASARHTLACGSSHPRRLYSTGCPTWPMSGPCASGWALVSAWPARLPT